MKLTKFALVALATLHGAAAEPFDADKFALFMAGEPTRHLRNLESCFVNYKGSLTAGWSQSSMTCEGVVNDPCEWDYWKVDLQEGTEYTIKVNAIDCDMDPAVTLLKGTDQGAIVSAPESRCSNFGTSMTFIECADDNNGLGVCPADLYGSGEDLFSFYNPIITFTPDETTWYTLAIQNYIPNGRCDNGAHEYEIDITPPPLLPNNGGAYGDPHIKLWNGTWIDYHGECDLVLVDAPNFEEEKPLKLHMRTTPRYIYSYVEAAVLQIDEDVLEVGSWGEYALNGVEGALTDEAIVPMVGGYPVHYKQINKKRHEFDVVISPTETIKISTFKDMVSVSIDSVGSHHFDGSVGIMGSIDGVMLARDGKTVINDPNSFGQEWQVTQEEPMLFRTIRHPQHPQKCILNDSTSAASRRLGENGVSREAAELACANVPEDHKGACVLDVMAVGDIEIVTAGAY